MATELEAHEIGVIPDHADAGDMNTCPPDFHRVQGGAGGRADRRGRRPGLDQGSPRTGHSAPWGVSEPDVETHVGLRPVEAVHEMDRVGRHQGTTWPISRTGSCSTIFLTRTGPGAKRKAAFIADWWTRYTPMISDPMITTYFPRS